MNIKIERHLAWIDAKLDEYNKALSEADEDNKAVIEEAIKKQTERKEGYEQKRLEGNNRKRRKYPLRSRKPPANT